MRLPWGCSVSCDAVTLNRKASYGELRAHVEQGTGDSDGLWVGARTEEGRGRVKSQAWLVPGDYLNTRCCICLLNKGYLSTDAKRLF